TVRWGSGRNPGGRPIGARARGPAPGARRATDAHRPGPDGGMESRGGRCGEIAAYAHASTGNPTRERLETVGVLESDAGHPFAAFRSACADRAEDPAAGGSRMAPRPRRTGRPAAS